MNVSRWTKLLAVFAVFALTLGVAACGDDDSDSGDDGGGEPAASNGDLLDAGARTIGVIPSTADSEHLAFRIDQLTQAADFLGWEVITVSGEGNPEKMEQGMQRLVGQDVDAIMTMALGGEEIPNGLKQAKNADIPVIAVVTEPTPDSDFYDAVFGDPVIGMGEFAGDYIVENRPDIPVAGMRITQNFAGDGFIQGAEDVLSQNDIEIDPLLDTDLADIVNSMTQNIEQIISQTEGEMTFIEFSDFAGPLMEPVLNREGRSEEVFFMTRYENPSTVALMEADAMQIGVVTSKSYEHMFDAMTALLELWTEDTPLPPYQIDTIDPTVFTTEDVQNGESSPYDFEADLEAQESTWAETYVTAG